MFFHPRQLVCYRSSIMKKPWSTSSQKLVINPDSLEEGSVGKEEAPRANLAGLKSSCKQELKLVLWLNLLAFAVCTYYIVTQVYLSKSEEIKLLNVVRELTSDISNFLGEINNAIEVKLEKTEATLETSTLRTSPEDETSDAHKNDPNNNLDSPEKIIARTDNKFVSENGLSMIEEHDSEVTTSTDYESTMPNVDSTTFASDASDMPEMRFDEMEVISDLDPSSSQHLMIQWPVELPKMHEIDAIDDAIDEMMETDDDNLEHYGLFWLMLQNAASNTPILVNSSTDKQTSRFVWGNFGGSSTEWDSESLGDEKQTTLDQSVDGHDRNENTEERSTADNVNIQEDNTSEDTNEQKQTTTDESNKFVPEVDVSFDEEEGANSESAPIVDTARFAPLLRKYYLESEPFQMSSEFGISSYSYPSLVDDGVYPTDYMFREQYKRSVRSPTPATPTNGNNGERKPQGVVVVPLHRQPTYRRPIQYP